MAKERAYDLQDRLIDYAVRIIKVSETLPETTAGRHVSTQILRSGTSPAPNYGEAQSADARGREHERLVAEERLAREDRQDLAHDAHRRLAGAGG